MSKHRPVDLILFDVYGTLLDQSDIKRKVNRLLDSKRAYRLWSETLLHYMLVDNATTHHGIFDIAKAAMKMTAASLDVDYTEADFEDLLELYKHLPLQENAQEGLSMLKDMDYRFAALTNFPLPVVTERMERTGLVSYFEYILSAETFGKYKPDSSTYLYASQKTGVEPERILMITSHGWDIAGAKHAGLKSAYIERGGEILYPLSPEADFFASNLPELAGKLS